MVIGVPIRKEDAAEASMVEKAIQQAIKEAEYELAKSKVQVHWPNHLLIASDKKIHGNDVTPFMLQRVNELTGGESLKSSTNLLILGFASYLRTPIEQISV